jgi:hypothetical protein
LLDRGHTPEGVGRVVRDHERTVVRDGDPDGPSPNMLVVNHKARQEVLILARRHAVFKAHANDVVAGAVAAVPGAVHRNESISQQRGFVSLPRSCDPAMAGGWQRARCVVGWRWARHRRSDARDRFKRGMESRLETK